MLHRAWTRYWARGRWNLFLPSWIASPHQHHSACAQRYQIATLSTWQTNKTSTAPKKTSSPLRQNDKKQNQKTPTKQKSQKQKVSSYNCSAKKPITTTSTQTKKNNLGEEPSQLYGSSLALADLALPFTSLVLLLRLHFTYFYIFQEASIASPPSLNFLRI